MFPEVCSHSCSHVVIAPFTRVLYKRVYYKASTRHRQRQGPMGLQPRGVDSLTCTCTASRPVTILTERPLGRRGPATALVHEYAVDPSGKGAWSAEVGAVPAWSASRGVDTNECTRQLLVKVNSQTSRVSAASATLHGNAHGITPSQEQLLPIHLAGADVGVFVGTASAASVRTYASVSSRWPGFLRVTLTPTYRGSLHCSHWQVVTKE